MRRYLYVDGIGKNQQGRFRWHTKGDAFRNKSQFQRGSFSKSKNPLGFSAEWISLSSTRVPARRNPDGSPHAISRRNWGFSESDRRQEICRSHEIPPGPRRARPPGWDMLFFAPFALRGQNRRSASPCSRRRAGLVRSDSSGCPAGRRWRSGLPARCR